MAEIKFSMRTEALNVLVEFAKAFIDTKAQMVHLRNAHCVVHGHDLEVSLVNPHTAARVTVPIIEKIEDGTEFDIRVPKKWMRRLTRPFPSRWTRVPTLANSRQAG